MTPLRLILCLAPLLLGACATTSTPGHGHDDHAEGATEKQERLTEQDARRMLQEARAAMKAGDYETAISQLEALEARFPFGVYAQQALLEIAYAYYRYDEPESAIATLDRFVHLYPRHPRIDYARYLQGVVLFQRIHSPVDRWLRLDPADRDPEAARRAFRYFAEVVRDHPDSPYAPDALQRMIYLRNLLARHELRVADFYLRRGAYVAAANRGRYLLEHLPRTPAQYPVLAILESAYEALGLTDLAADVGRVRALNPTAGDGADTQGE